MCVIPGLSSLFLFLQQSRMEKAAYHFNLSFKSRAARRDPIFNSSDAGAKRFTFFPNRWPSRVSKPSRQLQDISGHDIARSSAGSGEGPEKITTPGLVCRFCTSSGNHSRPGGGFYLLYTKCLPSQRSGVYLHELLPVPEISIVATQTWLLVWNAILLKLV